jgi:hypothetical protein
VDVSVYNFDLLFIYPRFLIALIGFPNCSLATPFVPKTRNYGRRLSSSHRYSLRHLHRSHTPSRHRRVSSSRAPKFLLPQSKFLRAPILTSAYPISSSKPSTYESPDHHFRAQFPLRPLNIHLPPRSLNPNRQRSHRQTCLSLKPRSCKHLSICHPSKLRRLEQWYNMHTPPVRAQLRFCQWIETQF